MFSSDYIFLFYILLPLVAFLYAAVGHGGASGYLALMIIFSFPEGEMKSTALILNICVSAIAFASYLYQKHFDLRIFFMVGIISIPAAFFGGRMDVNDQIFKKILGVILLIAILKLLGLFNLKKKETDQLNKPNLYLALLIGAGIGFLSGLLGIGGGILLTPLLLFLRWTTVKVAAGISALFIFVNSVSGLIGQISEDKMILNEKIGLLAILAVCGGLLGGDLGSSKLNNVVLRYLLAIVLLIATYKLFFN